MKPGDLPVFPATGVVVHCPECGADHSAMQSDYWFPGPGEEIRCPVDGTLMVLMRREVHYIPVTTEEAETLKEHTNEQ